MEKMIQLQIVQTMEEILYNPSFSSLFFLNFYFH
jgi:hypothetical protein